MILYTPLPMEMVLKGLESDMPTMSILSYKGRTVMGYKMGDGRYELTRILSTDPKDFLQPDFQPGNQISPD
ncbi:hypothetical protein GJ688_16185 [Heliobacillus mobilis]|uniref:YlzJ-like protein n=2 Tax=Heliobacterium TaxID=2697 RepID=A0A6I3SQW9_HELMO|nr:MULTISPECIES: YlzJ-like family protein [Heliobacterium]MBC9786020.1 YlzJ-like family protein [Heliobacterium chlorum]MTV50487.1 hypothetical protein [Heliobacterium mobile]